MVDPRSSPREATVTSNGRMLLSGTIFTALFGISVLLVLWIRKGKFSSVEKSIRGVPAPKKYHAESEVVIVGSGVLGSALAAVLGRDGRQVTVVERDLSEPNRIVGELLQPGGCQALRTLGLQDATAGIDACVMKGYVIHNSLEGSHVQLRYPLDERGEVMEGRAFHHGRFVMGLRNIARQEDNVSMVEGTVTALLEDNGRVMGVAYHHKGSEEIKYIKANLTIVCDGCFSKFRRGLVTAPVHTYSHFVGVVMRDCPQYSDDHAELVLTKQGGPVLVYQIGSAETRVLVDVREPLPKDMTEYLLHVIAPQMPDHLHGPFVDAVTSERIRRMPASFLPPSAYPRPGVVTLGDAFNMRHPLTGGGMTVALKDVIIWRRLLSSCQDLSNDEELRKKLKLFSIQRKSTHAFVVNILAQALYELFAATDAHLLQFREACFAYFKLGGMAVSGPIGLLSVVTPKPFVLLGHFFAVAFYAIYFAVTSVPLIRLPLGLFNGAAILWKAFCIISPLVWSEVRTVFNLY